MAWNAGKSPILTERDKAFIDLMLSGVDKFEAYEKIYPEKVKGRSRKQVSKSIRDLLDKPKCKEYKQSLENNVAEAFDKEAKRKAKEIVEGIMTEEELMLHYSNIARDEDQRTSDRLKALDSLSKYLFNLDKKQIDLQGELQQQIVFIDDFDSEEGDE